MSGLIALSAGGWKAGVLPNSGGLLTSLSREGTDILRPMPAESHDPLQSACFPLVPYTNRIADARFAWQGEDVQLPRNFAPESSSIHGMGWQSEWRVSHQHEFKCTLEHEWDAAEGWPWGYAAQQRIRLGKKGLAITLNATNRSARAMPMGLGLHPYFRRRPETKLTFSATGAVATGDAQIPDGNIIAPDHFADFAGGAVLPETLVDHCFVGWDGTVRIEDDLGAITLSATGAPFLHVYVPADGTTLCLEPVSHKPDALNQDPAGMTLLPPGCSASLQMWISAEG